MTPELEQLGATLDGLRAGVLKKLAGPSEDDTVHADIIREQIVGQTGR